MSTKDSLLQLVSAVDGRLLAVHQWIIDVTQWKIETVLGSLCVVWMGGILAAFCVEQDWNRWLALGCGEMVACVFAYATWRPVFRKRLLDGGALRQIYLIEATFSTILYLLDFWPAEVRIGALLCVLLSVTAAEFCQFASCQPPRPRPRKRAASKLAFQRNP